MVWRHSVFQCKSEEHRKSLGKGTSFNVIVGESPGRAGGDLDESKCGGL